jgi:hypothetical protein
LGHLQFTIFAMIWSVAATAALGENDPTFSSSLTLGMVDAMSYCPEGPSRAPDLGLRCQVCLLFPEEMNFLINHEAEVIL